MTTSPGARPAHGPPPARRLAGVPAYTTGNDPAPLELKLDANEGPRPPAELFAAVLARMPALARAYPDPRPLEAALAQRFGVAGDQVFVGAGADEVFDRLFRATLEPGRRLVLPWPSFVVLPPYAALAGGEVVYVPWQEGPFPVDRVLAEVDETTAVVPFVSPNNPSGAVGTEADLVKLATGAPQALVVLDHAYAEFTAADLTAAALELPNVVVLRTFSKAFGLAGLRVGFALGPAHVIDWLRRAGGPYSVASLSLELARTALDLFPDGDVAYLERIRRERTALRALLLDLGAHAPPSEANFVLGRFADAAAVHAALLKEGIAVRAFGHPDLRDALRITCPGDDHGFARLVAAFEGLRGRPEVAP